MAYRTYLTPRRWIFLTAGLISLPVLAFLLAWVSNNYQGVDGWGAFLGAMVGCVLLLGVTALGLRNERLPGWLLACLGLAVLLRLLAGVFWFTMLPVHGYHSPAEQSGYVMADASERDRTAWELGRSDKPLLRAFQGGYRKADQYGGLLFLSALVYRSLGGATHHPLLMVVFTASFSSLALLFAWGLARRAWGEQTARWAAWGLAFYPEAILLGSSQMREAFTITLAVAAFYGLVRYEQDHHWSGLAWSGAALLLSMLFSPPFTMFLAVLLALVVLVSHRGILHSPIFQKAWFRWLLLALIVLAFVGTWLSWQSMAPGGTSNPLEAIRFWVKKSAEFQAHLTERASGWVQKIFDSTPDWLHLPLLVGYGIVQPFLPAALVDISGAWIWQAIAIWRSLGWTGMLALLVYAPLRAWRPNGNRLARGLSLAIWLVILVASLRSGGDAWDNPRYRAMFAALQVALAAWVWVEVRRQPDPWLRRVVFSLLIVLTWFIPWYLRRYMYLPWPIEGLFTTLGLGVFSALVYWIIDLALERMKKKRRS